MTKVQPIARTGAVPKVPGQPVYADVVAGNGTAGGGLGPVVQPAGFESGGQRENKFCGPRERSPSVK